VREGRSFLSIPALNYFISYLYNLLPNSVLSLNLEIWSKIKSIIELLWNKIIAFLKYVANRILDIFKESIDGMHLLLWTEGGASSFGLRGRTEHPADSPKEELNPNPSPQIDPKDEPKFKCKCFAVREMDN